eukprot:s1111_g11.t1
MRVLRLFRPWPSGRSASTLRAAPPWWQRGWPRQRVGSVAEVELLAPLAELLMPQMPIAELFRSFPSPKGWGGNYLEPDLTVYGVLKDENAGLFVEYDGYWRHGEKEGVKMDQKKNFALLMYAPKGSYVIRISHKISTSRKQGNVIWVKADTWRSGQSRLLGEILCKIIEQAVYGLKDRLDPKVLKRLEVQTKTTTTELSSNVIEFMKQTKGYGRGNTMDEISVLLKSAGFDRASIDLVLGKSGTTLVHRKLWPTLKWLLELGLTTSQAAKALAKKPNLRDYSIQHKLKPSVQWLLELGLTKSQVVKTVALFPGVLGLSIEKNLKPSVRWLLELGLTKSQVAKIVAKFPQILGYSIVGNLKPTVQWLIELGLTKSQVAKALTINPQFLGNSMENTLKPTVQWLLDLGLTQNQVVKTVARFPGVLGLSVERKLEPTVQWLLELGLTKSQVAKGLATKPQLLGYSIENNLKPTVHWLFELGLAKSEVAKAVARFPSILGYSIAMKLKPTVQWFLKWGLTQSQVAKAVTTFPPLVGCSIANNLSPKMLLLKEVFTAERAAEIAAKSPFILGLSYNRLSTRLTILSELQKLEKFQYAMLLPEGTFQRRFLYGPNKAGKSCNVAAPCCCFVCC